MKVRRVIRILAGENQTASDPGKERLKTLLETKQGGLSNWLSVGSVGETGAKDCPYHSSSGVGGGECKEKTLDKDEVFFELKLEFCKQANKQLNWGISQSAQCSQWELQMKLLVCKQQQTDGWRDGDQAASLTPKQHQNFLSPSYNRLNPPIIPKPWPVCILL